MSRLFTEGLTIGYAEELATILPAGLVISGRKETRHAVIEVAAELAIPVEAVRIFSMEGGLIGEALVAERTHELGSFRYGEVTITSAPRFMKLELYDGEARLLATYSPAVDTEVGWAFPYPTFTGSAQGKTPEDVRLIHAGPPGLERLPGAVNILNLVTEPGGMRIDFLMDDRGRAVALTHEVRSVTQGTKYEVGRKTVEMVPFLKRADSPRRGQIRLPLGVRSVSLRFLDAQGAEIPPFTCRLDLAAMSLGPDVDAVVAKKESFIPDSCELDLGAAGAEAEAEGAAPARPGKKSALLDLLTEFQSFSRGSKDAHKPSQWPREIGADGAMIGPPGFLTPEPVLRLRRLDRVDQTWVIEVAVDDGGHVSKVLVGTAGEILAEQSVTRLTPMGPAAASLEVPVGEGDLYLFLEDRFGRSYPNLSALLDGEGRVFRRAIPDDEVWYPRIRFRGSLDLSATQCAVCSIPLRIKDAHLLPDMDVELRRMVKTRHAPTPEAAGICGRCRGFLEADRPSRSGWRKWLALHELGSFAARAMMATLGAFLPATAAGQGLIRWLGPYSTALLSVEEAVMVTSLTGALLLALLPQEIFLVPLARFAFRRAGTRSARAAARLPPGMILLLLLGACAFFATGVPYGQLSLFYNDVLPVVLLLATVVGHASGVLAERVIRMSWEAELEESRRIRWRAEAADYAGQILRARSAPEFEKLLEIFAVEGLRAASWQLFRYDPGEKRFLLRRYKTPDGAAAWTSAFSPGDGTLPGEAVRLGRPLSRVLIDLDDEVNREGLTDRRSQLALPVGASGRYEYVLNVDVFAMAGMLAALSAVIDPLAVMLRAAHENTQLAKGSGGAGRAVDKPSPEALVETFGAYFPADFLRRAEDEPQLLGLDGEETELSMLVGVVSNFDQLRQDRNSKKLVRLLSRFYGQIAPFVVKRGGFVETYQEGMMVSFFGRPRSLSEFAAYALAAANEIREELPRIVRDLDLDPPAEIHFHLGLATGKVILGNIGTPERFRYAALGPTVVLAKEIAQVAGSYGVDVVACPRTLELSGNKDMHRLLDRLRLAGSDLPVPLTEVLSPGPDEIDEKSELFTQYRAALADYMHGGFREALSRLDRLLSRWPGDSPSRLLKERCLQFMEVPPVRFDGAITLEAVRAASGRRG